MFRYFVLIAFCLSYLTSLLCAEEVPYEPLSEKWLSVLDRCTLKIRSNMEGIRTWQGKVLYKRKQPAGKWVDDMEIVFYADRVQARRLIVTKHLKTEISNEEQPLDVIGIFIDKDNYYEYRTRNPDGIIPIPGGKQIRLNDVKQGKVPEFQESFLTGSLRIDITSIFPFSHHNLKDNFNPFVVLLDANEQDVAVSSMCHYLAEIIRKKPVHQCTILLKEENSKISISFKRPKDSEPDIYIYDMQQGGNIIYSKIPCFGSDQLRNVEYEKAGEYFVPKKVDYKLREEIHETIEFISQKINEPIPDDTFSPKTLGVKQTDRVFDARTKTLSKIDDADYPRYEPVIIIQRTAGYYFRIIIIVLGITLILIAFFRMYRKYRAKHLEVK